MALVMLLFTHRQVREAMAHAAAGGQALHIWRPPPDGRGGSAWPGAPPRFRKHRLWGHLLDQDLDRLIRTAHSIGIPHPTVERPGQAKQHIDLCGEPLDRAIAACEDADAANHGPTERGGR